MGMSTLHHHFRALTAMSPLQYQKQLRLVAARERMLIEGLDAASAAFQVGLKAEVSSTASTNASLVNLRYATLKRVGSRSSTTLRH
jgi:methylphosphotriester-DNA--protein-cysteine methyltransferase